VFHGGWRIVRSIIGHSYRAGILNWRRFVRGLWRRRWRLGSRLLARPAFRLALRLQAGLELRRSFIRPSPHRLSASWLGLKHRGWHPAS
jgi:hypothetical protein